ncbi:unnamed protein product [Clavelina lepadiformis]|uniref:Pre-rRNA-processing protein Ipi1 N-terminal domain-containing protein n=1 Tax=Clavelina lepadiformis TaxID=159417 RepID=A0ABP0FTI4_CLALP
MGKTSRKTRAKKKDFNKVKLKVGKKKPQASNFTETSFKSRSIYIPDQLKTENQDEVVSRGKQNLDVLLSHLNHSSPKFRYRALCGIKEILIKKQNLNWELPKIFEKISKLIVDDNSEVRSGCISCFQILFKWLPEVRVSPFFSLILSYLYCAMSHLSIEVQKDSLKILDLCLENYLSLVQSEGGTKLLEYFIELISTNETGNKSRGRMITMKFSKHESALKWRTQILACLLRLLSKPRDEVTKPLIVCKDFSCHIPIGNALIPPKPPGRGLIIRDLQLKFLNPSKEKSMKEIATMIIPLLVQCWLDASSAGILQKNVETTTTMLLVVKITFELCSHVIEAFLPADETIMWLRKTYMTTFTKHFFNNFPFEQIEIAETNTGRKGRKSKIAQGKDIILVNLVTCNLITLLNTDKTIEEDGVNLATAASWLSEFFSVCASERNFVDNQNFYFALSSFRKLILLDADSETSTTLISSLYRYFQTLSQNQYQRKILRLLIDLSQDRNDSLFENPVFREFLNSLPSQLITHLKELVKRKSSGCKLSTDINSCSTSLVLHCIKCVIIRREKGFVTSWNNSFHGVLSAIEEQYSDIFCTSEQQCMECSAFQKKLVDCSIFHFPSISIEDHRILSHICHQPYFPVAHVDHIMGVLQMRIDPRHNLPESDSIDKLEKFLVIRFMLSVLLGVKTEEERTVNDLSLPLSHIQRHSRVVKCVCDRLLILANNSPLPETLLTFLRIRIFIVENISNVKSSMGLLGLGKLVCSSALTQDLEHLGRMVATFVVNCFTNRASFPENCDLLLKRCVDLLSVSSEISKHCVENLTTQDSSVNILALTELLRISQLRDRLVESAEAIFSYIERIKTDTRKAEEVSKLKTAASLFLTLP